MGQENKFEVRNIEKLQKTLTTQKLNEMESKYGIVDFKKQKEVICKLGMSKKALSECLKGINECIGKTKKRHLSVKRDDFEHITGYNMEYLQGILDAINAPKDKKNKLDTSQSKIKKECFVPVNKRANKDKNALKRGYSQIKIENEYGNRQKSKRRRISLDSNPYLNESDVKKRKNKRKKNKKNQRR